MDLENPWGSQSKSSQLGSEIPGVTFSANAAKMTSPFTMAFDDMDDEDDDSAWKTF